MNGHNAPAGVAPFDAWARASTVHCQGCNVFYARSCIGAYGDWTAQSRCLTKCGAVLVPRLW